VPAAQLVTWLRARESSAQRTADSAQASARSEP
jgi:hypothetical protein